jgi:hypothetical protein
VLPGRERERAQLAALVEQARAGTAGVLVVLGEPGVGKTALLNDLTTAAQDAAHGGSARVLRTAGVESESPLPYAALHRLLRPVSNLDRLPAPQSRALRIAFGVEDGFTVEPFLVGVATLSVLTEAAEVGVPLLCVVDDAQWLDSASADAESSHCASSTTHHKGAPTSAASVSTDRVATPTRNGSTEEPSSRPNTTRNARDCGAGSRSKLAIGRSRR